MGNNANLLRRSLKVLGFTGTAFAERLTALRDDGKVTTPATVSRWLTGGSPVDPGVIGWLTELVRSKVRCAPVPVMTWPPMGSIMIAVGNLKGGAFVTTIAAALAIVAARKFGLRVRHFHCGTRPPSPTIQRLMRDNLINTSAATFAEMLEVVLAEHEVVIVDVTTDAAHEALGSQSREPFLSKFEPDIFLVPANFEQWAHVESTRTFVDYQGHSSLIRLLHRARNMSFAFVEPCREHGFELGTNCWVPFIMSQSENEEFLPANAWQADWPDKRQENEFSRLFEYIVNEVGGDMGEWEERELSIDRMVLSELLGLIER